MDTSTAGQNQHQERSYPVQLDEWRQLSTALLAAAFSLDSSTLALESQGMNEAARRIQVHSDRLKRSARMYKDRI